MDETTTADEPSGTTNAKNLTGEHPLDLRCNNCGEGYRIDETVGNDCPVCGFQDFEILDSDRQENGK